MLEINVKDYNELDEIFSPDNEVLIEEMYKAVTKAYKEGSSTAEVFKITVGEADYSYEVSVPREEWQNVLDTVLSYFHKEQRTDDCIDVWQLQEGIKAGKVIKKKVANKNK
jgi:3-methyladenine DNA glycosylase AlkD